MARGTENIQGISGSRPCDLASPSLCFSLDVTGQLLQHGSLRLIVPQLVLLPVKKGDCSSPEKVLGLTLVCVELVVGPNWNRLCGQREALTGQARPGVGGVTPFLAWGGERCFQGKAEAPPLQGADGVSRSLCPPHSLCPPGPQPCGGRRNFHIDSIGGRWCCGREHPDGAGTSAGALLKVQRITINRRRTLEITCLKEAQFGDGTWQLALFWTF